MTFNNKYSKLNHKSFDISYSEAIACGTSSIDNYKIKRCKICTSNGYPHEPIIFRKNTITEKWIPHDYFTGRIHEHKRFEFGWGQST